MWSRVLPRHESQIFQLEFLFIECVRRSWGCVHSPQIHSQCLRPPLMCDSSVDGFKRETTYQHILLNCLQCWKVKPKWRIKNPISYSLVDNYLVTYLWLDWREDALSLCLFFVAHILVDCKSRWVFVSCTVTDTVWWRLNWVSLSYVATTIIWPHHVWFRCDMVSF